jgi:hypothetical protein
MYCPKTPVKSTMPDNIPPMATGSSEKISKEVRLARQAGRKVMDPIKLKLIIIFIR